MYYPDPIQLTKAEFEALPVRQREVTSKKGDVFKTFCGSLQPTGAVKPGAWWRGTCTGVSELGGARIDWHEIQIVESAPVDGGDEWPM